MLNRARQYIDLIPATDKTSQSWSKTTKKFVSTRSGNSVASKTSNQRQKELPIAKNCREELECQYKSTIRIAKQKQEIVLQKFQQEQQRLHLKKERLHQEWLRLLQEKEQQLQFEKQRLQHEQLLEVLELKEEAKWRIAEVKTVEIL